MQPTIFVASPRRNGNSDHIAGYIAAWLARRGRDARGVRLREYTVLPCIACDVCKYAAQAEVAGKESAFSCSPPYNFACPLIQQDSSAPLLQMLVEARLLIFIAPVYFYHLPAACKALIDRTQPFWNAQEAGSPSLATLSPGICLPIFPAGRRKGEKLVVGSMRSLRQALLPLGYTLADPLVLRGLDAPEDFSRSAVSKEETAGYLELHREKLLG